MLKGIKQEKGCFLYLSQINIEIGDTNHDICDMIRCHSSFIDLRIMSVKVIRNRYCDYVVGCRIKVPEAQEQIALNEESWPDEVSCRRWEMYPEKFQQQRQDQGYDKQYDQWRPSTNDDSRYYESDW